MIKIGKVNFNGHTHEYHYIENEKNDNVIFFLNGSNGSTEVISTYKHQVFKENYIVTFDNIAHGNNTLDHSSNYLDFLNFAKDMIANVMQEEIFKGKKVILIGESFGASLILLLATRFNNIADLFFPWNAPSQTGRIKGFQKKMIFSNGTKKIFTLLTNIETYSIRLFGDDMTTNKAVLRINKMAGITYSSNKLHVAILKSILTIRRILRNAQNLPHNCIYNQSFEDIMYNKKLNLDKFENINFYKKGFHLLSFEPQADELFDNLQKAIKNIKK
ncbi:MAG: alpha/beta fold hydrolase [Mycoplasma sp.]